MFKYLLILLLMPVLVTAQPYVLVLGTAQDGGYPHIGCKKDCCTKVWNGTTEKRFVVSLAVVDPETKQWWLFEATPDIKEQLQYFNNLTQGEYKYLPDGIFLTHAHMGHYTGLAQLGREALGAKGVKVYALPKMKNFLATNGPWNQLISLHNIDIQPIKENSITGISKNVKVKTYTVPHRDEYSETAGFTIITTKKKYLFIPDINKWDKWDRSIVDEVKSTDIALLDATFYDDTELPGRRMDEVPHPFVKETISLFSNTDAATRAKVYFIHFNHTNPLLWNSDKQIELRHTGHQYAVQGMRL